MGHGEVDSAPSTPTAPIAAGSLRAEVARAFRDSVSVGVAASALGLAFGVLVVHAGLDWWWATVFASVIFAGSLEFLLLGLVTALAPLSQVAAAAFLVNFRHVFYALSFPLHRVHGAAAKAYSTFTLTDEAYALTAGGRAEDWSRARILALQAFIQAFWVLSVTVGALGGTLIPDSVVGLDFAITALFVVLAIDAFRVHRDIPNPIVAVACALAAHALAGERMLVAGMGLYLAYLLARYAATRLLARRSVRRSVRRSARGATGA